MSLRRIKLTWELVNHCSTSSVIIIIDDCISTPRRLYQISAFPDYSRECALSASCETIAEGHDRLSPAQSTSCPTGKSSLSASNSFYRLTYQKAKALSATFQCFFSSLTSKRVLSLPWSATDWPQWHAYSCVDCFCFLHNFREKIYKNDGTICLWAAFVRMFAVRLFSLLACFFAQMYWAKMYFRVLCSQKSFWISANVDYRWVGVCESHLNVLSAGTFLAWEMAAITSRDKENFLSLCGWQRKAIAQGCFDDKNSLNSHTIDCLLEDFELATNPIKELHSLAHELWRFAMLTVGGTWAERFDDHSLSEADTKIVLRHRFGFAFTINRIIFISTIKNNWTTTSAKEDIRCCCLCAYFGHRRPVFCFFSLSISLFF